MSDPLRVDVVAADHTVWSGEATIVLARTTDGDIGILANHAPVLSVMTAGPVEVRTADGDHLVVAVDEGFISVAKNRVSILAEYAQLASEIDLDAVKQELERAQADDDGATVQRSEAQIRAVEKAR